MSLSIKQHNFLYQIHTTSIFCLKYITHTSRFFSFGFDLTTKILPFFEKYFGITFKLPKIDLVAVPDFGFSAMENWGLITFRLVRLVASFKMHWCFVFFFIEFDVAHCRTAITYNLTKFNREKSVGAQ